MNKEDIKQIISDYDQIGFSITVRDIMFAMLRGSVHDDALVYSVVYGKGFSSEHIQQYMLRAEVTMLCARFSKALHTDTSISKDENRRGLEADLRFLNKYLADNKSTMTANEIASIVAKTSDLRMKLDKVFGGDEKTDEQRIIVFTKKNHICERDNKECHFYTKEYAMKHFGLVEPKNKKE